MEGGQWSHREPLFSQGNGRLEDVLKSELRERERERGREGGTERGKGGGREGGGECVSVPMHGHRFLTL